MEKFEVGADRVEGAKDEGGPTPRLKAKSFFTAKRPERFPKQRVLRVEIANLHLVVTLSAAQCRFQHLLPQRIEPELFFVKPPDFRIWEVDPLCLEIGHGGPEARGVLGDAFSSTRRHMQIELRAKIAPLISGALAVHRFEGVQKFGKAVQQVLGLVDQDFA